jgi:hypothetical protein
VHNLSFHSSGSVGRYRSPRLMPFYNQLLDHRCNLNSLMITKKLTEVSTLVG